MENLAYRRNDRCGVRGHTHSGFVCAVREKFWRHIREQELLAYGRRSQRIVACRLSHDVPNRRAEYCTQTERLGRYRMADHQTLAEDERVYRNDLGRSNGKGRRDRYRCGEEKEGVGNHKHKPTARAYRRYDG